MRPGKWEPKCDDAGCVGRLACCRSIRGVSFNVTVIEIVSMGE
jgi:hypothetical protein